MPRTDVTVTMFVSSILNKIKIWFDFNPFYEYLRDLSVVWLENFFHSEMVISHEKIESF